MSYQAKKQEKRDFSPNIQKEAATFLKTGGIVVFPTDTAYAIGGDFTNDSVTERILKIKHRRDIKFTLIAASLEQAQQFFSLSPRALKIAQRYWPGPLSIVVSDRFSIRVPDNEIARALADVAGVPLIATSANVSGAGEVYTLQDARTSLDTDDVDMWIDGGELSQKPPSTIIAVNTNTVHIIRNGAIEIDPTLL